MSFIREESEKPGVKTNQGKHACMRKCDLSQMGIELHNL